MNPLARYKSSSNFNPCPDLITIAERQLSAFFAAITQLFGSEQAELSAEDWLRELVETDALPSSAREWRLFTAKVSARLASRLNASALSSSSLLTESQIA